MGTLAQLKERIAAEVLRRARTRQGADAASAARASA
jgi:hypothetical protein